MAKVKVIDRGWKDITKKFRKLQRGIVASVGVQGSEASADHGGPTNVMIGSVHEYGTKDGRIPARPHWRPTFDENAKKYQKELDQIAVRVYTPGKGDARGDLMLLGETYKTDVIRRMHAGISPEAGQGDPRQIIDTGQYVNSFSVVLADPNEKQGK